MLTHSRPAGVSQLLPLLITSLGIFACSPNETPPNFLLISIDTLRADHLGCYGYERPTSPRLDAFAARSLRFSNARAPAPWTLPSHFAMLSGQHPYAAGIVGLKNSIPPDVPMLAERLQHAGYATAAFVDSKSDGLLGAERGFSRGFKTYEHSPHKGGEHYYHDVKATVDAGLDWLRRRDPTQPFLLFLHTKSAHSNPVFDDSLADSDAPYRSPAPYGERFLPQRSSHFDWHNEAGEGGVRYLREMNSSLARDLANRDEFSEARLAELKAMYDGGIVYVDHHIGRLLGSLKELGLDRNTVIIVTSDHGEAFLEHYFFLHKEIYDPLLHIPLIVYDPKAPEPGVVSQGVSLMDIAPTILARAGIQVPEFPFGRPLPSKDSATGSNRHFFSSNKYTEKGERMYESYKLDAGRYRLLYHRRRDWPAFRAELFDVWSDPGETRPIEGENDRKRTMLAELVRHIDANPKRRGEHKIELDRETREHLRALGYVE